MLKLENRTKATFYFGQISCPNVTKFSKFLTKARFYQLLRSMSLLLMEQMRYFENEKNINTYNFTGSFSESPSSAVSWAVYWWAKLRPLISQMDQGCICWTSEGKLGTSRCWMRARQICEKNSANQCHPTRIWVQFPAT